MLEIVDRNQGEPGSTPDLAEAKKCLWSEKPTYWAEVARTENEPLGVAVKFHAGHNMLDSLKFF